MPHWLRITLTAISFAIFFGGSMLLGLVVLPTLLILSFGDKEAHRRRCTRLIGRGYGSFLFWMKLVGLIGYERLEVPEALKGRAYVLIANHPSLIDVLFLLHWFEGLTSVVKASWYHSSLLRWILLSTNYLASGGTEGDDDRGEAPALTRMVEHLEAGHPLVFFPEGTRSPIGGLHRFRRGAFEAAARAKVPLVRVFITQDRPVLKKGMPIWKHAKGRCNYRFELLEIIEPEHLVRRGPAQVCRDVQADYRARLGIDPPEHTARAA